MSSPQPNTRRRKETRQSPFKMPDDNNIFLLSAKEKKDRREEMRQFLALSIDEKMTRTTQMMAKQRKELLKELDEEEEARRRGLKQTTSKIAQPKQTPRRHELKMAMMKQQNILKDSKHDLISMERQKAVLELSLMTKRSEILKMDKAIAKEERMLKQLENIIEKDGRHFEELLRENEKKSVEARTFFDHEAKSKQQKNAEIRKLTSEIGTIQSELIKFEETLKDYKRYKKLLFRLSPPEWQEAQKAKLLNKVLDHSCTQDAQSAVKQDTAASPGDELPSIRKPRPSSTRSSRVKNSKQDSDSSEYEDDPELYFTDPQQLLDLMTELTEQNLSLIQNSARVEETLEELQQSMETTRKRIEKDEKHLTLQINDTNQRIAKEKVRAAKLEQKVQLHVSLNTEDQDDMLDALSEKVAEVHRCCIDDRVTNLSTLEKLASIEKHMSLLLQSLESIPEESLEMIKKIKDSERRTRQREEKLREQREKQKERMRRYLERSLADAKKTSGRKLVPRCIPVAQKVKVKKVASTPAEDDLHAYLFTSDYMD